MQNQQKMMKQLQQMQTRMAKMQEELDAATVTGTAGGGAVTVTANGQQRLVGIAIEAEALEEGPELLGDMLLAACNAALDAARELQAKQLSQITSGLGLPPGLL